jgi:hypothetical protein
MLTSNRHILPKLSDTTLNLKYKNLLCSGCSFTACSFLNDSTFFDSLNSDYSRIKDVSWPSLSCTDDFFQLPVTIQEECLSAGIILDVRNHMKDFYVPWPYFLADRINIETVYNCAAPGGGNQHIFYSIVNAIENTTSIDPKNTLVVLMWSSHDRDDFMIDKDAVIDSTYSYSDKVKLGSTGGLVGVSKSNIFSYQSVQKSKSDISRALENYLLIMSMAFYLKGRGFDFVFTEFFKIKENAFQPHQLKKYKDLLHQFECLGDVSTDLCSDNFHPSSQSHSEWVDDIFLPFLTKLCNTLNGFETYKDLLK